MLFIESEVIIRLCICWNWWTNGHSSFSWHEQGCEIDLYLQNHCYVENPKPNYFEHDADKVYKRSFALSLKTNKSNPRLILQILRAQELCIEFRFPCSPVDKENHYKAILMDYVTCIGRMPRINWKWGKEYHYRTWHQLGQGYCLKTMKIMSQIYRKHISF